MSSRAKTHYISKLVFTNNEGKGVLHMNIKEVDQTFKQIIEAQMKGNLTGEQFIKLKELQTLLKVLEENNKQYRKVVDSLMA